MYVYETQNVWLSVNWMVIFWKGLFFFEKSTIGLYPKIGLKYRENLSVPFLFQILDSYTRRNNIFFVNIANITKPIILSRIQILFQILDFDTRRNNIFVL